MSQGPSTANADKNPIANMEGLQAAIANGETARVDELLANQKLDELQKGYLIELAELANQPEIAQRLKQMPVK